ncbi:MAG: hypothetical protein BWY23_02233 [Spirochaetes bacterium ADurb.Bin218]|jgi:hypothetical protein|nr:hypothetical protein [Spirochaetota bacterium]OQA95888.1 MAG: hypothetical protein BWY23_02233 [Spirochaetes bacterium ADurb.Bin218]HOV09617.1 hypothetical protein [Spirochaetota bacterium]HPD78611.1 hypothetical protein [Spirochaetota bacterium]HPX90727.1 hypothetical protein [Spirochaetota bacterium]
MTSKLFWIFLALLVLGLSCGKKYPQNSPENIPEMIKKCKNLSDISSFYTKGTMDAVYKYQQYFSQEEFFAFKMLQFMEDSSSYKVIGKKEEHDFVIMDIRLEDPKRENINGIVLSLKLIQENGQWKIDKEDDIKRLLNSASQRSAEGYLNKLH